MTPRGPKPRLNNGAIRYKYPDEEQYVPLAKLDSASQATFPGFCGRCERKYAKDDWVFRDGEGRLVGVNCCATEDDTRPAGDPVPLGGYVDFGDTSWAADTAEEIEGRDFVPLSQVMPTGRTKRDMCPRCFQIPSSSGVCGC